MFKHYVRPPFPFFGAQHKSVRSLERFSPADSEKKRVLIRKTPTWGRAKIDDAETKPRRHTAKHPPRRTTPTLATRRHRLKIGTSIGCPTRRRTKTSTWRCCYCRGSSAGGRSRTSCSKERSAGKSSFGSCASPSRYGTAMRGKRRFSRSMYVCMMCGDFASFRRMRSERCA